MRPEGIAAAQREIKRLRRATRRIAASDDLDDAEDAWVDFLTHANRVYLKLRAACHGQGVDWMWWKKKMDERRDDPLLLYVHKARNCDTHRLEEITARKGDAQKLGPLPVVDENGAVFPVPSSHKDVIFKGDLTVFDIALIAGSYLDELVKEAASRLR